MGKPMDIVYIPDENGNFVPTRVPTWVGFVGWYAGPEPPDGYLYCDGSAIGRETYSELYEAIGTLYGAGDGAETFNLPDARGIFFRGDGGNAAAMGVKQGDAIRNITGDIGFWMDRFINKATGVFVGTQSTSETGIVLGDNTTLDYSYVTFNTGAVVPTAAENRPVNVALLWCIIYE